MSQTYEEKKKKRTLGGIVPEPILYNFGKVTFNTSAVNLQTVIIMHPPFPVNNTVRVRLSALRIFPFYRVRVK